MELILWRHAEAEMTAPDLKRELSSKGQKQARRMAEWLDQQLQESCRILISPATRTLQTVEPLGRKFKVQPELGPGADPRTVLELVNWPRSKEPVLVVGHQPTLGQLAALLLCGEAQEWNVKKASVWWFVQREAEDPYSLYLKAVMSPDMIVK